MATPIVVSLTKNKEHSMGEAARKSDQDLKRKRVINAPVGDRLLAVADEPLNNTTTKPIGWLVGVHGGAGATTLAALLAPFMDSHGVIPAQDDPRTCILVAQSHKAGLKKLLDAILQFDTDQAGGAELLGVVIVETQPGKTPKALLGDIQRITEAAPGGNVWHVPFVESWRTHLPKELPEWAPGDELPENMSRSERKARSNPLRFVPESIAVDAADMFERALVAYKRQNS